MLPQPDKTTILEAVADFLKRASQQTEPPPGTGFQLRLASSLVAMVARECALEDELKAAHAERFPKGSEPVLDSLREDQITPGELSALTTVLRADLADQLRVIAPHFDTRLRIEG